jgi:hypothetical protein
MPARLATTNPVVSDVRSRNRENEFWVRLSARKPEKPRVFGDFFTDECRMNGERRGGSSPFSILSTRRKRVRGSGCQNPEGDLIMKTVAKLAVGALMAAGVAVAASAPAEAGVHVGIGVGVPVGGYYGPNYCYGPYADPYYCGYPGYYGPGYVGFGWGWGHGYWGGGYGRGGWGHGGWGHGGWGHAGFGGHGHH